MLFVGVPPARAFQFGAGGGAPQPILLRLTGFIGSAPAGVQTLGRITFGVDHTVVTFDLSAVQMLNGPLTEGLSALRQLDLYRPNLLLIGEPAILAEIKRAPRDSKLTLFGYEISGSQRWLVVEVDPA